MEMNKENFKTLLLAFLVCISIYFVKGFWSTELHNNYKNYSQEIIEDDNKNYKLYDVIIPQKTIISFDENSNTLAYSNSKYNLWKEGKSSLEDIFSNKSIDKNIIDPALYNESPNDKSVDFQFSQKLYTHMVGKILGIEIPKEIYQTIKTISSIKFSIGEQSFLILSNDSENIIIKINSSTINELKNSISQIESSNYTKFYKLEDVLGVKSDVYIPVKSKNGTPMIRINAKYNIGKEINLDDTIAELFFYKKIEYIKKIEESSGARIYIDGEDILKIYKDGKLEYIGGIQENNDNDLYSSLKKSVDFISSHRGWPENVYLSDIENIEVDENIKGFKFIFRYKLNGLTVFSDKRDIQDKIEIEVLNGSITSYKSRIWNNLSTVTRESDSNNMSAFEIIDNNFLFLKEQFIENSKDELGNLSDEEINEKVKSSINDVYLAYYGDLSGKQEILKPVWIIEILGIKYPFDAYSGEVKS